ncbi:hypothetical protein EGT86_32280 [Burkholderia pseudomallei]|nr:hypothetical protein EGT86_32280 [Burkholderia pseudomallei]
MKGHRREAHEERSRQAINLCSAQRGWTCDEIADHTDLSRMGRSTSASGTRSMVRRLCATNPVGARGIEVVR